MHKSDVRRKPCNRTPPPSARNPAIEPSSLWLRKISLHLVLKGLKKPKPYTFVFYCVFSYKIFLDWSWHFFFEKFQIKKINNAAKIGLCGAESGAKILGAELPSIYHFHEWRQKTPPFGWWGCSEPPIKNAAGGAQTPPVLSHAARPSKGPPRRTRSHQKTALLAPPKKGAWKTLLLAENRNLKTP